MKINNLYLAHPLEIRHGIRKWELEFEKRTGIQLINPFYDVPERDDMYAIDSGEKSGRAIKKKSSGLDIVERDLKQIEKSDGIVAFIEKGKESFGTPMEYFYSSRILQKPTYAITSSMSGHPWIRGLATKVFKNVSKFEEYIKCHT